MAHVAPGVYTKIIDLSEYVAGIPSTIGFLPIICEQGPDNQLIQTNAKDFYVDFGEPNISYAGKAAGQGPYIAGSYLRESDSLYVIRCLPEDANFSNLSILAEAEGGYGADSTSDVTIDSDTGINTTGELETLLTSGDACIVFYGVGRGDFYNNFQVSISKHSNPQLSDPAIMGHYDMVYVLDLYKRQSEDDEDGLPQYEIISSFEVSFNPVRLDASGESMFIGDIIDRYSRYVKCVVDRDKCGVAVNAGHADFSQPFVSGAINLDNGDVGSLFTATGIDLDVAKQILGKAYTGTLPKTQTGLYVDEVLDTEDVYFTIVLDGGYATDVKSQIYTLVQTRKDCVALIDNGDNTTPANAIVARDDNHTYNTKYMALYESYSKIYDTYTGRDIWVSPIYHMANIVPYTDNVAEVWWAPAGFNRATIGTIKELRYSPRLGERDNFYLKQINPIVKFNVGYTVFSQLTTQKRPSALQDLNIIRLVLYCKRAIEQFAKFFIFEQNDALTWSSISIQVNKFLKVIQDKRGLYSYSVDVGASEYELKSKQIHLNVTLEPTRVVEQIYLNFFIK